MNFFYFNFHQKTGNLQQNIPFIRIFFFLQDGINLSPKKALPCMGFQQIVKLPLLFLEGSNFVVVT
jgi:hypothetical protein